MAGTADGGQTASVAMLGRARLRAGRLSLVVLAALVAVTGAAAITALTGARRTLTAFDRLRATTGDPDAEVSGGRGREVVHRAVALPDVESYVYGHHWVSRYLDDTDQIVYVSMVGYERSTRDLVHPLVVDGRVWDPSEPNEVLVTEATAARTGVHVGSSIHLKTLLPKQFNAWDLVNPVDAKGPRVTLRVVGLIRDPFDAGTTGAGLFVSPAFYRHARSIHGPPVGLGGFVRLRDGTAGGARFASQVDHLVDRFGDPGAGDPDEVRVALATDRTDVSAAAKVAALGLVAFAAVAALAGLITLTQALGREMNRRAEHNLVWAALGLTNRDRTFALAGPPMLAVLAGTVGAVVLAVLASPLTPIGAARTFEPSRGLEVNLALLALGGAVWLALLAALVFLTARRGARIGRADLEAAAATSPSAVAAPVMRSKLPAPVAVGLRMALEQRAGGRANVMRTPIITATVAIAALVGTLAFSASLLRLVSEPARYGWKGDGTIEVPENVRDTAPERIASDASVDAATQVNTNPATVGGRRTVLYGLQPLRGSLGFTTLEGRPPAAPDEVVIGPELADHLGKGVGEAVAVRAPSGSPHTMRIVGLGLTIGADGEHFDEGALVTGESFDRLVGETHSAVVLFRLRDSVADKEAAATRLAGDLELVEPQRPGSVAYLEQLRYLPRLLAALLGAVGIAAVAHGFIVGSRRWSYELAVLRVFGFTRRQIAAAIGTMASATIVIGSLIGVPAGLILARLAWSTLAADVNVATDLARPVGTVTLLVLAALAIANALAAAGARGRRGSHTAIALRTE